MSSRVLLLSASGRAEQAIRQALDASSLSLTVVSDAGGAQREAARHQLIIVDAASDDALVKLCQSVRKGIKDGPAAQVPVLAITGSDEVEQRIRLLEAGAQDVLALPFDTRELEALVDALLLRSPQPGAVTAAPGPGAAQPAAARPGQVFVFAAAKGGVGSTSLAVNTAVALAEASRGPVALADLDFHHGQLATHLDVQASVTTADIARDDITLDDPAALWQSGVTHSSGVHVYPAPNRPDLGAAVDHQHCVAMLRGLRRAFPLSVIDAGSVLEWRSLALMEAADRVVITVTPEIPSLRLLHGALEVMAEGEAASDRTLYILNNIFSRQTVTAEQIQEHLTVSVSLEMPYDAELYLNAANEGTPLMLSAGRSAPAEAIRRLAALLRGEASEAEAAQARKGLLGGLLKRN